MIKITNIAIYYYIDVGSSPIIEQMGNTITGRCAIAYSKKTEAPCTKSQVVVMLCRTNIGKDTPIVEYKREANNIMLSVITKTK